MKMSGEMVGEASGPSHYVAAVNEVLFTRFEGTDCILLDTNSGNYLSLDGVAGYLWLLWNEGLSIEQTIDRLMAKYSLPRETAEADVRALVESLLSSAVITVRQER